MAPGHPKALEIIEEAIYQEQASPVPTTNATAIEALLSGVHWFIETLPGTLDR